MIETLIWDFNGTILDDLPVCLSVINKMLTARRLPAVTRDQYLDYFDFPVREYYLRLGFDMISEPFEQLAAEYMDLYLPASLESPLQTGVLELLDWSGRSGLKQILLSASHLEILKMQVAHLGIETWFDDILGIEDVYAFGKADLARNWLTRQGGVPSSMLMIGDTTHDAEVARILGCSCILVAAGHQCASRLEACGFPVVGTVSEVRFAILKA